MVTLVVAIPSLFLAAVSAFQGEYELWMDWYFMILFGASSLFYLYLSDEPTQCSVEGARPPPLIFLPIFLHLSIPNQNIWLLHSCN